MFFEVVISPTIWPTTRNKQVQVYKADFPLGEFFREANFFEYRLGISLRKNEFEQFLLFRREKRSKLIRIQKFVTWWFGGREGSEERSHFTTNGWVQHCSPQPNEDA